MDLEPRELKSSSERDPCNRGASDGGSLRCHRCKATFSADRSSVHVYIPPIHCTTQKIEEMDPWGFPSRATKEAASWEPSAGRGSDLTAAQPQVGAHVDTHVRPLIFFSHIYCLWHTYETEVTKNRRVIHAEVLCGAALFRVPGRAPTCAAKV